MYGLRKNRDHDARASCLAPHSHSHEPLARKTTKAHIVSCSRRLLLLLEKIYQRVRSGMVWYTYKRSLLVPSSP